jgi:phage terminase small subunit
MKVTAPKHLSARGKRLYRQTAEDFELGDEPHALRLLEEACTAVDRAEQARKVLAVEGTLYHDRFGAPRAHPAVKTEADSQVRAARLFRELSLDGGADYGSSRPPRIGGGLA